MVFAADLRDENEISDPIGDRRRLVTVIIGFVIIKPTAPRRDAAEGLGV